MESDTNKKIKIKLVKAHHWNIIFYIPSKEGIKRFRIRQVNEIKYIKKLTEYVERNGESYTKPIHSIYNGVTYYDEIYEITLPKDLLLKLIEVPGRKAPKYEQLMKMLQEV